MGMYDAPLSVFALSRTTKLAMGRINFLIKRYRLEAVGEDERREPLFWLADIKTAAKQNERRVSAARSEWARRNPQPRY
jgi:hypothetical protein